MKQNCAEFEYQPHGIFGSGSGSPLGGVTGRKPRPLGLLAAAKRGDDMAKKKKSKAAGKAKAAAKSQAKQDKKAGVTRSGKGGRR